MAERWQSPDGRADSTWEHLSLNGGPDRGIDLNKRKKRKDKISDQEGGRSQNTSNMAVKVKETTLNVGAVSPHLYYIHFKFQSYSCWLGK